VRRQEKQAEKRKEIKAVKRCAGIACKTFKEKRKEAF